MIDQTLELTGSAVGGVGVAALPVPARAAYAAMVARLPVVVKLGRIEPPARPQVLRFGAYFNEEAMAVSPPPSTNRRATAAASLTRIYMNDQYGDCVIAGKAHALGLWSGADATPGGVVVATDQEIYSQYQGICGPGDNGCIITQVLDVMTSKGFLAGGKYYKIDGYVAGDHTNKLQTQVILYLFGASTIGIKLPQAWTSSDVWDVTNSRIVGGHDVTPIDYDEKGVYVASWGRIYLMTWAAFQSRKWVSEFYALLAPLWYGGDNLAPSGVDAATLLADLKKIDGGGTPPIPEPPPPKPPEPPAPPPGPGPDPGWGDPNDNLWVKVRVNSVLGKAEIVSREAFQ